MTFAIVGLIALIPTMIGPLPQASGAATLIARLCNGGTIVMPLPDRKRDEPVPCPPKGCHAGCDRKRFDPSQ